MNSTKLTVEHLPDGKTVIQGLVVPFGQMRAVEWDQPFQEVVSPDAFAKTDLSHTIAIWQKEGGTKDVIAHVYTDNLLLSIQSDGLYFKVITASEDEELVKAIEAEDWEAGYAFQRGEDNFEWIDEGQYWLRTISSMKHFYEVILRKSKSLIIE